MKTIYKATAVAFLLSGQLSLFSQSQFIYTEALSMLRGNQAINLSYGQEKGKWYYSFGLDYIVKKSGPGDEKIDKKKLSWAFVQKVGYDVIEGKAKLFIGIHQKLSQIVQFDLDYNNEFSEVLPYHKSYSKYTAMVYIEPTVKVNSCIYLAFELGFGYALIFNDEYELRYEYDELSPYDGFVDLSYLIEHGEHRIGSRRNDAPAFQLNIGLGIYL